MVRIALLALVASVGTASANAAKGWEGGDRAGEPIGITDIAITREELVIDMRPMTDRGALAKVSATYHLDNRGPDKQLDLVFAMGSPSRDFRVLLDGKLIATMPRPDVQVPESWQPPRFTPGFDGGELYYGTDNAPTAVAFRLVVPAGRHDLAVTYDAEPVQHHIDSVLIYQFAYVLSPAREWAGFGGLELVVHVPPDWKIAVTPALEREGDTLRGSFTTVPADAVALTIQTPTGLHSVVTIASLGLFAIVALGGISMIVWRTRVAERRRRAASQFPFRAAAFGRGVAWGTAFLGTGLFAVFGPDLVIAGQGYHRGYGQGLAAFGLVVGTFLVILIGWIVSHSVGRRVHFPEA